MKKTFITTVLGPDSPGIFKSLAKTTRFIGGEWLTSKVMKLDGRFSALLKVVIDDEREAQLKSELEREFPKLQFIYSPVLDQPRGPFKQITLVVDCQDRAGLTKDINAIFSNLDIEVEHMEFHRVHVSTIGQAMFSAKVTINVPDGTSSESIADEVEALSEDVRVSVI